MEKYIYNLQIEKNFDIICSNNRYICGDTLNDVLKELNRMLNVIFII